MQPSDMEKATVTEKTACLGTLATVDEAILILIYVATAVASFGIYVCVAMVLFTDAKNNPQLMTTLQVFWWIQTAIFALGVIYACYYGPKEIGLIAYIVSLFLVIIHICVALLLFAKLSDNQQLLTTLRVFWSIETAIIGIAIIDVCCICYLYGRILDKPLMLHN
jgi:hypothetical protein